MNVLKLENIAQDGSTSGSVLTRPTSHGFSGVSHFVLAVGINDASNTVPIAKLISSIASILTLAKAANVKGVVLLQDTYPRALADNFGFITDNTGLTPSYRQAIDRVAA